MISRFFIDRPIFAAVLSIVITLGGLIATKVLPIALYPPISPPVVQVDCNYPGASAQTVSETVAAPIEQQVNGVENMLYMSSQCTNDGTYNLTVTFKHGVDLNMAQVLVQNRVSLALPLLPDVLKQTGVNVKKKAPDILMAVAINSPDGSYDQLYLSNYAVLQIKDELARLPGVSDVTMLGQRDYSMRIWLNPEELSARNMTAGDIALAVRAQNTQVAAGQIGQPPAPDNQAIQVPLDTLGRLAEVEQFENIIVKADGNGRITRLKDIARVELGAKNQDISCKVNGVPSATMAVFQLPDANALDCADIVKAKMAELAKNFPKGMRYEVRYDTTPYIYESIGEVVKTLRDAVILVAFVVLLFLQNWRSAVIPLVAVPVAIIGTFGVMAVFGFTINNLTLFGLVLAIGIVVDDAIVVVEAAEHHIEHGLAPRAATIKAMDEVSGPVIAIGLVLSAVFVPCAFISGIVGQFFRQFALTIAASTIISAINSLTLSPALAAMLLRPKGHASSRNVLPGVFYIGLGGWLGWLYLLPWLVARGDLLPPSWTAALAHSVLAEWFPSLVTLPYRSQFVGGLAVLGGAAVGWLVARPMNWVLDKLFGAFNLGFRYSTAWYTKIVGGMLRLSVLVLLVYGGLLFLTYHRFNNTPTGFIPSQDMGYLMINVQLPDSASLQRTQALLDKIEKIAHETPGIKHSQTMTGQSMLLSANGSNFGSMFVMLDPFHARPVPVADRFFEWLDEAALRLDYVVEKVNNQMEDAAFVYNRDPLVLDESYRLTPDYAKGQRERLSKKEIAALTKKERDRRRPLSETWFKTWVSRHTIEKEPVRDEKTGRVVKDKATGRDAERVVARKFGWLRQPKLMVNEKTGKLVPRPSLYGEAIQAELRQRFTAQVPEAMLTVLGPPPVRGVGRAGGFKLMVEDRGDNGSATLQGQTEELNDALKEDNRLVGMTSVFRANTPSLFVDVNRPECMIKEVRLQDLFDTLRIYLGSLYVNDFNKFGRTWQVIVQADQKFRNSVDSVRVLKVRNSAGNMVPLGTLANVSEVNGPLVLTRYNMYPAAPINGAAQVGTSSGESMQIVDAEANRTLLESMKTEWTELAYLEREAGNTAMVVFGFAVVMVFLVLAAQYESWSLPLAVILVVPMCLLSAIIGVTISFSDVNIFTQIGFVVLVGLASKNAILIVEFAKARREEGVSARQAALDACQLRFRPIVMTSLAFILGVIPLILSAGAGAEMRRTLGTTVFSGMLGVTVFGVFLTPVFFAVVDRLGALRALNTGPLRWVGDVVLDTLSLGVVRRAIQVPRGQVGRHQAGQSKVNGVPIDNGNTSGNGNGNGAPGSGHTSSQPPGELVEHE